MLMKGSNVIKYSIVVVILLLAIYFHYVSCHGNAYLWSFINSAQLMFHLPLVNVDMPGNAAYFCNILMGAGRLELLPGEWLESAFGL